MALILGNLWNVGDVGIRKRVLTLLHQKSLTLASVRAVLRELRANIGDEGAPAPSGRPPPPPQPCIWLCIVPGFFLGRLFWCRGLDPKP